MGKADLSSSRVSLVFEKNEHNDRFRQLEAERKKAASK